MAFGSFGDFWGLVHDLKDEIGKDRVLAVAAGVTFHAILALVPAITAMISIFGLVLEPAEVPQTLASVTGLMPGEAATLLTDQATRIAAKEDGSLSLTALVALVIALWSANGGTKALIEALGIAYDVEETRGFVKLNLVALGFTLAGIVAVIVVGAIVAVLPFLAERLGGVAGDAMLALRWPILFALLLAALAAIYRWAPNRPDAEWVWITPGAVVAAVGLIATSAGLAWYVSSFGSYDETYGSLAAVVILMLWIWLSTVMVLIGAEVNAEMDRRKRVRVSGRFQPARQG
ncbi:YihY/virulence factor BrkB family protein [Tabrizicola sp. BL-A-41-H6]|uniref:YihY/virulence factor BrkB family protein n=1 Tax=Tabrizicola sp. BL-A-41-H6 TaxID=3421107 RepID=UPI003D669983